MGRLDAIRTRYDAFFGADFMPLIRNDQTQGAEDRASPTRPNSRPSSFGQIDKKLGRLIELLEQRPA